jgi:hypothetical protein
MIDKQPLVTLNGQVVSATASFGNASHLYSERVCFKLNESHPWVAFQVKLLSPTVVSGFSYEHFGNDTSAPANIEVVGSMNDTFCPLIELALVDYSVSSQPKFKKVFDKKEEFQFIRFAVNGKSDIICLNAFQLF